MKGWKSLHFHFTLQHSRMATSCCTAAKADDEFGFMLLLGVGEGMTVEAIQSSQVFLNGLLLRIFVLKFS